MSQNTVFIIGAGASKEALLPTGRELKDQISSLLDIRFDDWGSRLISGDYRIMEALRLHVRQPDGRPGNINPYLHESWHIKNALPQAISIDNFIDTQRDNEKIALCGKLAIIRAILDAERESLLYVDWNKANANINFHDISETWYVPFFQLLTANCTKDDLEQRFKAVTLIVFNYDRCIEHFLYYGLQNYYKLSKEAAAHLVKSITIYHPYGNVGTLPWATGGRIEFGMEPSSTQLLELASQIKTFTEGTDPHSSEILEIRKKMDQVDRLVFMGFAFHDLNMQLISPSSKIRSEVIQCFATTLGISASDTKIIKSQISQMYNSSIQVETTNSSCKPFFTEFWRSLNFSVIK